LLFLVVADRSSQDESMRLYLLVIAVSGLATVGLVPLVKMLSTALGALDYPTGRRKIHNGAVPRLGGVAVFLPVVGAMAAVHFLLPGTRDTSPPPRTSSSSPARCSSFSSASTTTCGASARS
jgi:UDP-N-acetylmuramyl pentapeptide phosphotransferase/UDP-N-acetylglucosamine-1-phosphate transferase